MPMEPQGSAPQHSVRGCSESFIELPQRRGDRKVPGAERARRPVTPMHFHKSPATFEDVIQRPKRGP